MKIIARIKSWLRPKPEWMVTLTFEKPGREPYIYCYLTRHPPYHLTIGRLWVPGYLTRIDVERFDRP